MEDLDQTQWDHLAKKVCDLLIGSRKQMDKAIDELNFAHSPTMGVQSFKLERYNAARIIEDWISLDLGREFLKLPTKIIDTHPSLYSLNNRFSAYAVNEIQSHIDFLDALIKRVRFGPIEFEGLRVKRDQKTILEVFLAKNEAPDAEISFRILTEEFGFEFELLCEHIRRLTEKGMIRQTNGYQEIVTQAGIRELKIMANQESETLEQKRFRVLKTVYDLAPDDKHGMVGIFDLAKALTMGVHEVTRILSYWEEKGMVAFAADEAVRLTAPAIDELEEKLNHPTKPTKHFPYSIQYIDNSVNITGDIGGNVVGGQGNTYNEITNESLSSVLPKLAEFIEVVRRADFENRDEVIRDLETVYALAQRPIEKSVWEVIQAKFKSAEALMKLARFGYATYTHWPQIPDTFHRMLQ
jgi:hypothetical protein